MTSIQNATVKDIADLIAANPGLRVLFKGSFIDDVAYDALTDFGGPLEIYADADTDTLLIPVWIKSRGQDIDWMAKPNGPNVVELAPMDGPGATLGLPVNHTIDAQARWPEWYAKCEKIIDDIAAKQAKVAARKVTKAMQPVESLLANNAFDEPFYVEGREAVANLFPKTKRCGIYVLHFGDGMHYVGLTTDVSRRYVEHRRNYRDIVRLSFKQVKSAGLAHEERRIRNILQDDGHTLRGVVGVHPLPGEADLDLILPVEAQQAWLDDLSLVDYSGSRAKNPALRKTFEGKYENLTRSPYFRDVIEVLRKYVKVGIPRIRATEETFWSCSCLPKSSTYARINIQWQEVFGIHKGEGGNGITFGFQMALSSLRGHSLIKDFFNRLPDTPFSVTLDSSVVRFGVSSSEAHAIVSEALDNEELFLDDETKDAFDYYIKGSSKTRMDSFRYIPGGDDQIRFDIDGKDRALSFLDEETVIAAIRKFNLRLMRLGPSRFKTSHCLSLADLLVEEK